MQETIDAIRAAHRERCFAMEQRKRADLSLLSFLRTQAGWRLDLPEAERKAIAERAKAFADGEDDEGLAQWRSVVEASIGARAPFETVEKAALKRMEEAAKQLPVWETFGEAIRGFGPASLAVIVGEAGDLSIYSNPAKLWKRMGLAVMGDVRQGGLAKNASKEDWIAHGYNRQRRSRMWNIGDALIKGNRDGEYRTIYLQRKEYELARDPEMQPIKAHRRAQRYMEKRLLRNLWAAWRQTSDVAKPVSDVSAASHSDQQASLAELPNEPAPAAAAGRVRPDTQEICASRSHSDQQPDQVLCDTQSAPVPAAATGHTKVDAHPRRAGRSPSSEAMDGMSPEPGKPRKRRARSAPQPDLSPPGAPIQQADVPVTPKSRVPADTRGQSSSDAHASFAPRTLSRANGTGGQSAIAPQSRDAAR